MSRLHAFFRFERPKLSGTDVALVALALVFGAYSLSQPFGHDQGLYYYVGREWLQHGAIPYRDVIEQKTPGIFFIHAVLIALTGENQWAIRLAELLAIVPLAALASKLATPRDREAAPGQLGFAALTASVIYYGFFLYWDTAQCEIWCGLFALASMCAADRLEREPRAQFVAGVFGGSALVMKPPGMWLVALAAIVVLARAFRTRDGALRRAVVGLLFFALGVGLVLALLFGYFAAHRALPAMYDILVGANGYYVRHDRGVNSLWDLVRRTRELFQWYSPVSPALLSLFALAVFAAFARRDRESLRGYAIVTLLFLAGWLAIAMQLKFYRYHWGMLLPSASVLGAMLYSEGARIARSRPLPAVAFTVPAVIGLLFFYFIAENSSIWINGTRGAVGLARGTLRREDFTRQFQIPGLYYYYHDSELAGLWLRNHSSPADTVLVRGFNPEVYAVARRRYLGRFFWTLFLTVPQRAYRHAEWLEEDRRTILATHPRYVVTLTEMHDGLDSAEWFLPLGYSIRQEIGKLTILEANVPPAHTAAR